MREEVKVTEMSVVETARRLRKYERSKRRQLEWMKHWEPIDASPKNFAKRKKLLAECSNLHDKRVGFTRSYTRAAHLADGFLRGVPYEKMERTSYTWPKWGLIQLFVMDGSDEDPRVTLQHYAEWRDTGMKRGLIHVNLTGAAARVEQLARAFMRDVPYAKVEPCSRTYPDWKEIDGQLAAFGIFTEQGHWAEKFKAWRAEGEKRGLLPPRVEPAPASRGILRRLFG